MRLRHEVVAAYDAGSSKPDLRDAIPTIRFRDDWESLLGELEINALIVAGPTLPEEVPADQRERRDDQLRKLIQAGVPLVVIPPVCEAIVGFELEMIRRDVKGTVVPALSASLHPAVYFLQPWIQQEAAAAVGKIEMLSIERHLPVRQRAAVLAAFAHDVEILRWLSGPLLRVTASGAGRDGESKPSLANLAVHADTAAAFPVRWSVAPVNEFVGAKLMLLGSAGSATLTMPVAGCWHLQGPDLDRTYEPFDTVAAVLLELENAMASRGEPMVTWLDACRAVEAMEAIDRSLSRNRAIELHNEEHSEESSFKGIMAASGCLLLLGTLAAVSCAGGFAIFFPPGKAELTDDPARYGDNHSYWIWLQACLIVPLALFLLAQLLSFGLTRHLRSRRADKSTTLKPGSTNSAD